MWGQRQVVMAFQSTWAITDVLQKKLQKVTKVKTRVNLFNNFYNSD